MISAPRSVVVSVIFFPMGLFYYSSANGPDYTINERNPTAATAMKRERAVVSHERPFGWLLAFEIRTQAAQSADNTSACSITVRVAFSCLSGG